MARSAADGTAPIPQHSFSAGEVTPDVYGRQDLVKYHAGCSVLFNWMVLVQGGVQVRPGDQYIGGYGSAGMGRLWPFQFSPAIGQTYMLAFSAGKLRFIKNPGSPAYPNGSNAGFITVSGSPYELATPYAQEDLRSLHFLQVGDVMWISGQNYPRKKLKRFSDTSWTLTDITTTPAVPAPASVLSVTVTGLPSGSTDPANTWYMYVVSAVDENGDESLPSPPCLGKGINIAATQGTVTVRWEPVDQAKFYKVYKALPSHGNVIPAVTEQFGFAGYAYGPVFTDSNIVADFAHSPVQAADPFAPGAIIGYHITNPGSGYAAETASVAIADATGTGAIVYPVIDSNTAGTVGSIVGLHIVNPGRNYTAPTASASGGTGFAATFVLGPSTGLNPSVVAVNQQRLIYASTLNKPNSLFASRPGKPDDFRVSNPVTDGDAFEFAIFDQQITRINWLKSMPGGLLIGTDSGVVQLTGGASSPSNPAAVSATNAVIVPQSYYGTDDMPPIVIDYDVLFVQKEGIVRDLQYNFFANIYTGKDLTVLSQHMFDRIWPIEWAYQDVPHKIIWMVMANGQLYSLSYMKDQEVFGWARHGTTGVYESVATVQEGKTNAVYFSVNVNGTRQIRRQAGDVFFQDSDAWQLDAALSIAPNFPAATIVINSGTGLGVSVSASAGVFTAGDVGKELHAISGMATVVGFTDATHITVDISQTKPFHTTPGPTPPLPAGTWRLDPKLTTFGGLNHLEGMQVYALVNGVSQGPFTVSGGSITLTTPGSQVVVGLAYPALLQPLWPEPGEGTIQNRKRKAAAATIRVRNAKGLKYGTDFGNMKEWLDGFSSTDNHEELAYAVNGLNTGDQRIIVNQEFGTGGWVCVSQTNPYPATVLFIIPELAVGG